MPGPCLYPDHHRGGGGGFPWGLIAILIAAVIIGTSATFASVVHDVTVIILSAVIAIAAAAVTGWALWLHHQRAIVRAAAPRPIHMTARIAPGIPETPRRAAALGPPGSPPSIMAVPGDSPRAYVRPELRRGRP